MDILELILNFFGVLFCSSAFCATIYKIYKANRAYKLASEKGVDETDAFGRALDSKNQSWKTGIKDRNKKRENSVNEDSPVYKI